MLLFYIGMYVHHLVLPEPMRNERDFRSIKLQIECTLFSTLTSNWSTFVFRHFTPNVGVILLGKGNPRWTWLVCWPNMANAC